jgi:hypothetical protein
MNRSQAFKVMLPFIAVSFGQASGRLPAPRTDTAQHAPLSSEANASPSVKIASTLKETPVTKCKCRSTSTPDEP